MQYYPTYPNYARTPPMFPAPTKENPQDRLLYRLSAAFVAGSVFVLALFLIALLYLFASGSSDSSSKRSAGRYQDAPLAPFESANDESFLMKKSEFKDSSLKVKESNQNPNFKRYSRIRGSTTSGSPLKTSSTTREVYSSNSDQNRSDSKTTGAKSNTVKETTEGVAETASETAFVKSENKTGILRNLTNNNEGNGTDYLLDQGLVEIQDPSTNTIQSENNSKMSEEDDSNTVANDIVSSSSANFSRNSEQTTEQKNLGEVQSSKNLLLEGKTV